MIKKKTTAKAAVKKKPRLAEQLGLKRLNKLTPKNCLQRSKFLKKQLDKGEFKGELRKKAMLYSYWYKAQAEKLSQ